MTGPGQRVKQVWLSGGAPAACIVQAEDDSLWIMEAHAPNLRPRGDNELTDILLAAQAIEYRWRKLPPIPTPEQYEQDQEQQRRVAAEVAHLVGAGRP